MAYVLQHQRLHGSVSPIYTQIKISMFVNVHQSQNEFGRRLSPFSYHKDRVHRHDPAKRVAKWNG